MVDKGKKVGIVTHYYDKISVGIIKLDQPIKPGDTLHFEGHRTNFDQVVNEIQFNHQPVVKTEKGQEVGIKVDQKVRENDQVYLLIN